MDVFLAFALIASMYTLVYFRLMVRHHYEKEHNVKESTFGVLFSLPPHSKLNAIGKKYSRNYWITLAVILVIIAVLVQLRDFSYLADIKLER